MKKALYKFSQLSCITTNKKRPFIERLLIKFGQLIHIGKLISSEKALLNLDAAVQKYDYYTSKYAWVSFGLHREKEILPIKNLKGTRTGQFESLTVYIAEDAEGYLKNLYGNYMILPPKDNRISHLISFLDE